MKKLIFCTFAALTLIFFFSCKRKQSDTGKIKGFKNLKYASLFGIAEYEKYERLFYLNGNDTIWSLRSDKLPKDTFIAVLSSVFAGFLEELDLQNRIIAIDKAAFYSDSVLLKNIESDKVIEIGEEGQINMESLLKLKPAFLITGSFGFNDKAIQGRLEKGGITLLKCDNFKEQHPLARAEWIIFFGFLTGKMNEAESIFKTIEANYLQIAKINKDLPQKPIVMTDAMYQDVWNIPGGKSYTARLIEDAGGTYVFSDRTDLYTYPLNLETVLRAAAGSDYWINVNQFHSLNQMIQAEPRYQLFSPFKNRKVYNNNKLENPKGGNDFWERGVVRPDLILNDLSMIFSGSLINSELRYYKLLD